MVKYFNSNVKCYPCNCDIGGLPPSVWVCGSNAGRVKSKTKKLAPVASLVSVHYVRPRTGLVGSLSV